MPQSPSHRGRSSDNGCSDLPSPLPGNSHKRSHKTYLLRKWRFPFYRKGPPGPQRPEKAITASSESENKRPFPRPRKRSPDSGSLRYSPKRTLRKNPGSGKGTPGNRSLPFHETASFQRPVAASGSAHRKPLSHPERSGSSYRSHRSE